jgi:hypothetical protein
VFAKLFIALSALVLAVMWNASGSFSVCPSLESFSSRFPILVIDIFSHAITNRAREAGFLTVQVVSNGVGSTAIVTEFQGLVSIGVRGSSSSRHPKKPYRLEIQDERGEDLKIPLLGLQMVQSPL